MRNLLFLVAGLFLLNSCVELPNLVPNDNNGISNMVIVEYNQPIFSLDNPLIVDENLTIEGFVDVELGGCGNWKIRIEDGQILKPFDFAENSQLWIQGETYDGLTQGQLLGEAVIGNWQSSFFLTISQDFFLNCLTVESLTKERDVFLGIRFRIDNKWHYGWLNYFIDEEDTIFLKAVGYNKNSGVNVRIGG